jgi:hypothetical protein
MTSKGSNLKRDRRRKAIDRRRRVLAIASALILILTYSVKDVLKERAKEASASVESGESLYLTQIGQSGLSAQMLQAQLQMSELKAELATQPGDASQRDYSAVIADDLLVVQQVHAELKSDVENLSRFIDKLPSSEDLRKALDQLRPRIKKADQQVDDYTRPSTKNDLIRSVGVKLAIVTDGIQIILVAFVGDAALTRARSAKDSADKMYRLSVWLGYVLYSLGVALGLYAALSGMKGLESE